MFYQKFSSNPHSNIVFPPSFPCSVCSQCVIVLELGLLNQIMSTRLLVEGVATVKRFNRSSTRSNFKSKCDIMSHRRACKMLSLLKKEKHLGYIYSDL